MPAPTVVHAGSRSTISHAMPCRVNAAARHRPPIPPPTMSTDIARTLERLTMQGSCRVAVIDDYQRVARDCADWSLLGDDVDVTFFHDHVDEPRQLVNRLTAYDVVVAMRERTPFPGDV